MHASIFKCLNSSPGSAADFKLPAPLHSGGQQLVAGALGSLLPTQDTRSKVRASGFCLAHSRTSGDLVSVNPQMETPSFFPLK